MMRETELIQYKQALYSFAFSLTRNKEESEDLIQDTFYRALANRDKFSDGTNIKAWLFTIMRNIFINNYRRKQKAPLNGTESELNLNSRTRVNNGSERTFLSDDLQQAIAKVNSEYTEPFLMYFKGFQYNEIAESFQLPLGTVKSRIFFARKELQLHLKTAGIINSAYSG